MTDQAKHTPGPWTMKQTPGYSCGNIEGSAGYNIESDWGTVFHLPTAGTVEPEARHNALLIAASPTLLAACEYAAQTIAAGAAVDDPHFRHAHDSLVSVIALAREAPCPSG